MELYFFDINNRYIGHRCLEINEEIPLNGTTEIALVEDRQEAYFVKGKWVVNEIVE